MKQSVRKYKDVMNIIAFPTFVVCLGSKNPISSARSRYVGCDSVVRPEEKELETVTKDAEIFV